MNAVRLAPSFDPAGLHADFARIRAGEWIAHFNAEYFDGDWSGVALLAAKDAPVQLYADSSTTACEETELLARCPHIRAVIGTFRCPLRSVRLLKLGAGSNIRASGKVSPMKTTVDTASSTA